MGEKSWEMHRIRCMLRMNSSQMKSMKVKRDVESTLNKEFEHDEELRSMSLACF
jgi:hypothetical protein